MNTLKLMIFFISLPILKGCVSKVYSEEKLAIDPSFLVLFNSISQEDSSYFINAIGSEKKFLVVKKDSIVSNHKGWFINEKPYKLLMLGLREIGKDTLQLDRDNEITVNKDPKSGKTSLVIQFNNLFFNDTILPIFHIDTIEVNGKKLTNFYQFETTLHEKRSDDIRILFISKIYGILGFKTFSEEGWIKQ